MEQKTDVIGTCKECETEDCHLYDGLCLECFDENQECKASFHVEYVDMGCPFCDEVNTFNVPEPERFKCSSCGKWVRN